MTKPALHFVGFKDDRYWNAVKVFGVPDFYHRIFDQRAKQGIAPEDVVVFCSRQRKDGSWSAMSLDDPVHVDAWDDSQQDIIARGIKGVHW